MRKLLALIAILLAFTGLADAACSNTSLGNGMTCKQFATNITCDGAATCVITISATTAGSTLIVGAFFAYQNMGDGVTAITDSHSDAFTTASLGQWNSASLFTSGAWYKSNVVAGITSVTITSNVAPGNGGFALVTEVAGLQTSPGDQVVNASVAGCPGACTNTTSPSSGATGTLTAFNEYAWCFGSHNVSSTTYSAPSGGFTLQNQTGDIGFFDQAVTALTPLTCGATLSVARNWNMKLLTFKATTQPASTGRLRGSVVNR